PSGRCARRRRSLWTSRSHAAAMSFSDAHGRHPRAKVWTERVHNGMTNFEESAPTSRPLRLSPPSSLFSRRAPLIVIGIAGTLTGLIFGLFPQLDLRISALFYDPVQHTWPENESAVFPIYRNLNSALSVSLAVFAAGAGAFAKLRGRSPVLSRGA